MLRSLLTRSARDPRRGGPRRRLRTRRTAALLLTLAVGATAAAVAVVAAAGSTPAPTHPLVAPAPPGRSRGGARGRTAAAGALGGADLRRRPRRLRLPGGAGAPVVRLHRHRVRGARVPGAVELHDRRPAPRGGERGDDHRGAHH